MWKNDIIAISVGGKKVGKRVKILKAMDMGSEIKMIEKIPVNDLLQKDRRLTQKFLRIAGVMFVFIDAEQKVAYINKKACDILGYKEEEIIGKNWFDFFIPENVREPVKEVFKRLMTGEIEPIEYFENPVLTRDGCERLISWHNAILKDEDGAIVGTLGSGEDITERRQAEEMLRASEYKYRIVADNTYDWEFWIDPSGKILYASPSCRIITGYTPEEFIAKPDLLHRIVHPDDRSLFNDHRHDATIKKTPCELEFRIVCSDGSLKWIGHNCQPVYDEEGNFLGTRGSNRDITFQKDSQERLRTSEEKYHALMNCAGDAILLSDVNGHILEANKKAQRLFGHARKDFPHIQVPYNLHPEKEHKRVIAAFKKIVRKGIGHLNNTFILKKNGKTVSVDITGSVIEYQGEKVVQGIFRDITERKKAEALLKKSEEQYRSIFENTGTATVMINDNKMISLVNTGFEKLSGYTKQEIEGKMSWTRFVAEDDLKKMKQRRISGKTGNDVGPNSYEFKFIDRQERIKDAIITMSVIPGTKKRIGSIIDISKHKKLEEQLHHARRMESIGTLAGGIAHDFNNNLTVIIGCSELVKMKISEENPLYPYIAQISEAGKSSAQLTQSLLTFSRKQLIHLTRANLGEIITNTKKLLSRIIREDIELNVVLPPDKDLTIFADRGQIEQILMNLSTNARDAMPEGGLITIKADMVELAADFINKYGDNGKPGKYALISVTDTGTGIQEKVLKRVFEPFFTTKNVGEGTGLGLSIIYGIVKKHNGYIDVSSLPGKGTTFTVYLPALPDDAATEEQKKPELLRKGSGTILLAEDDAAARGVTKRILTEFGYTVIEAVDGDDAVKKFSKHKDRIKIAILDVIMPQKDGKKVYDKIRKIKPDIKVLFMSGYTADIIHKKGIVDDNLNFLAKPVTPDKLLHKIYEITGKI